MTNPLPIPDQLGNPVPPDAQAAIAAVFLAIPRRTHDLEASVHDLETRLKHHSTNSSQPPSSDPIGRKRKPPAPPSGRKRGGPPGPRKAQRVLVPPEKARATVHCQPTACRRGGPGLSGNDPEPVIDPVADRPTIAPVVDASRLARWTGPGRGETRRGVLPPGVPTGGFGPSLRAVRAMLAGADRLGKRPLQQGGGDRFGLSIATGMIATREPRSAAALEAPDHELATAVAQAKVVNSDATS
jgi:transposase